MAGRASSSEPVDLLAKIRGFVRSLLVDLAGNRALSVSLDRFKTYCSNSSGKWWDVSSGKLSGRIIRNSAFHHDCLAIVAHLFVVTRELYLTFASSLCSFDLPNGKDVLSLDSKSHAYRLDALLRVLFIVQQLLQEKKHASKRDIYYMEPSVFLEQGNVDRAINDVCILFNCSRHHLNVVPVGKGLVMGWLGFMEAGRKVYCIKNPNKAHPVPISVEEVKDLISIAHYVLVVEKETVFQRLANDKFCERNQCIVITGRGYPDVPTRRFLRHLVEQLHLPVYCLVDGDPYGFEILTTYRFGSMQMAYDAKLLRVPGVHWLGIFPSDFEKYHLPGSCLLSFTPEDKKKAEAISTRCYLQREVPKWRLELEIMLQKEAKVEIEALSVSSLSLSEYILAKIEGGLYI